jgi:5-formyltetrahydrofolate cyclo-ligase
VSLESEKARIRQDGLAACREIAVDGAKRNSERVAEHVISSPELEQARSIGMYAATEWEIGTRLIFEASRREGKCCVFPRCLSGNRLDFARVDQYEQLAPGRFGILEPEKELEAIALSPGDLVLVPGVVFDRQGGRLGRGGGYYDRTFPVGDSSGPLLMALAHSVQLIDAVPVGANDRRMDAVATESGIVRPG